MRKPCADILAFQAATAVGTAVCMIVAGLGKPGSGVADIGATSYLTVWSCWWPTGYQRLGSAVLTESDQPDGPAAFTLLTWYS